MSVPPITARAAANSVSGSLVGVMIRHGQFSEPATCTPLASAGSSPARNSDDLPAPDAPVTTVRPPRVTCRASVTASSVVSRSRAVKHPLVVALEWHQPAIRTPARPERPPTAVSRTIPGAQLDGAELLPDQADLSGLPVVLVDHPADICALLI